MTSQNSTLTESEQTKWIELQQQYRLEMVNPARSLLEQVTRESRTISAGATANLMQNF